MHRTGLRELSMSWWQSLGAGFLVGVLCTLFVVWGNRRR